MKVTVGKSKAADAEKAVIEATSAISAPGGILFQCAFKHLDEVSRLLTEKYPGVPLIGTGATSYYETESSDQILIVIAFGSDAVIRAGVLRFLSATPLYDISDLERAASEVHSGQDNTVCLEYCTNNEERLVTSMNVVLEKKNIPLVGGTVFGTPSHMTPRVCVNGKLYPDACAWMLIKNTSGKIRTYSENIYSIPENAEIHVATKADLNSKELISLDGRPAADIYSKELDIPRNAIVDNVFKNPLGRIVGDDTYIISQYEVTGRGGLLNYKQVHENDAICILELLDYREINRETRARIREENRKISLVFSVNCIYRHLFFTNENYLSTLLADMRELGTHVGVVGGGEQYKKQHVNQTLVCAVFE